MRTPQNIILEEGTITGVFRSRDDAENAYNALIEKGYLPNEIILLMSDETHRSQFKDATDTGSGHKAMENAGIGSAIGGTLGAIVGVIAAIGTSVALPGLGLVIAGPIVAGLSGAGAGGLTGGLIGGLIGSGMSDEHAKAYEDSLKEGAVVIGVVPKTAEDRRLINTAWRQYRGENIYGEPKEVEEIKEEVKP